MWRIVKKNERDLNPGCLNQIHFVNLNQINDKQLQTFCVPILNFGIIFVTNYFFFVSNI